MKQSGSADLALMGGGIPPWLYARMKKLSLAIVESILTEYGHQAFLAKLSDPFWFQSFGAVIGMDWNSSGVTTAVTRALKDSINPQSKELGLYVCGGKGKQSMRTPAELITVGEKTGLDGSSLSRYSKLVAKVDNTAVQDGFQLYLHSFLVSQQGDWTAIQQGMNGSTQQARRYHWHSKNISSFVNEPHAAVCGANQGDILNLVAKNAELTRGGILEVTQEAPDKMIQEIQRMILPGNYGVKAKDVNLKRLGSILWLAQESQTSQFEDLLLLKGLGPRTLQSLTLVSEVVHGTPSRFSDPARFSFAHGGKSGRPFPVPTKVYDETISTLRKAVDRAKIGHTDKQTAISKLTDLAQRAEENFTPNDNFEQVIEKEHQDSWKYGGRTVKGFVKKTRGGQLNLFNS
ncbi:MAG: DUF763 domain-containing protein [Tunicatimonas sp.]|uniref:DUF763 domain-containing protein n=1 Tax=Tunicatimonas sp. TaxID=1940096 RepID=UPI003C739015